MSQNEKLMLRTLTIMKVMALLCVILNFVLSFRETKTLLKFNITVFNIIYVGIIIYALLNGLGYGEQNTPMLQIFLLRCAQVLFYVFVRHNINVTNAFILCILDIIFIFYLLMHKSKYQFIEEGIEDNGTKSDD